MSSKSSYGRGHIVFCMWACLFGLLFTLPGCEDEAVQRDYPRIKTMEVKNITENGATFVAEVTHEGTVPITEHGFTWSLYTPDINKDERINLGQFNGTGGFEAEISTTLMEGITYGVCAFIKAGDYTVYGERVKFLSLGSGAPEIIDFMPKAACWGDTVAIFGRKFSHLISTNKIIIGDQDSYPFFSSDTLLKFVLPPTVIEPLNTLSVNILGNVATSVNKLTFIPPAISGFTPMAGFWGDTITFTGRGLNYFGSQPSDGIMLNDILPCKVVKGDDKSLSFVIPDQLNTISSPVSLAYRTLSLSFPANFTLLPPEADSISPTEGPWGTLVTLYGKFNSITGQNMVQFGDKQATIISSSRNLLVVRIPDNLTEYVATVRYSSEPFTCDFKESFSLKDFTVTNVTPLSGSIGDLLVISGTDIGGASVSFGSVVAEVTESSPTELTVKVPFIEPGEHDIKVTIAGRTYVYPNKYTHRGPWTRIDDLPFLYDYGCVFDFGEEIYIATKEVSATVRSIYKFKPDTEGFEKVSGTFVSNIVNPESCVSNGLGFILGIKEGTNTVGLEVFNPDSLTWRPLPDYPGNAKSSLSFFADNSNIYAGGGITNSGGRTIIYIDFWKYSLATKSWTRLANNSSSLYANQIFLNNKLLIAGGFYTNVLSVFTYNPASNSWSKLASSPCGNLHNGISNNLNGFWYIGLGDNVGHHFSPDEVSSLNTNKIYRFDPGTNSWYELSFQIMPARSMAISFTAGGYLYIGGDQIHHLYDFWRYDPEFDQ